MTLEIIATTATAWAWEEFGKEMATGVWNRLTKKFGQEWAEFQQAERWQTAQEAYRESLRRDHQTIKILGHSDPVTLAEIYTDLYLLDKVTARQQYDIQTLLEAPPDRGQSYLRSPDRLNGLDLVQQGHYLRLFILGKPGAGKTTFVRYLALQAVQGRLNKVPILINLKRWSTDGIPLMAYLAREFAVCGFPQAEPFITALLQAGQALVMFDGLDEVNQEGGVRQKITQKIDDFCRRYHKNQVLITCRIAATDHAFQQFQDVELADFNEGQIKRFVRKWFAKQPTKRQAFETQFFAPENKPVRELGNIPIFLTLFCLAFDDTMSFPRRRAELYEDALDALLRKWDSSRSIQRDEIYQGLSLRLKQRLFAYIAAHTFEKGALFFKESRLARLIEQFIERLPEADKQPEPDGRMILKAIEAQHSIFVERTKGVYSFSHLTFQEYFTAKYIADNERRGTVERLIPNVTDPRWREIFLLTVSLLDEADEFFICLQRAIDDLIITNPSLTTLLRWVEQKIDSHAGRRAIPPRLTDFRVGYLEIFIASALNLTSVVVLGRISTLDLARFLENEGILGLTSALVLPHPRARIRSLNHALDRNLTHSLEQSFGFDFALDMTLTYGWLMACIFGDRYENDEMHQQFSTYGNYLGQVIKLSQRLPTPTIAQRLGQLLQTLPQTNEDWQSFADDLQQLMQTERNLFPDIQLDDDDYEQLDQYLVAANLLQDCLALALVSNRAEITAQILRPPVGEGR